MEKEKKVVKKSTSKTTVKKVAQPAKTIKAPTKKPVNSAKPVTVAEKVNEVKAIEQSKAQRKAITLNQELNLLIGLFSLLTIIAF